MGLGELGSGPGGQLARGRRRGVQDRRNRRELDAEAVVENDSDPLARGEPVEHDVQGQTNGVGHRDIVARIVDVLLGLDVINGDRGP